MRDVCVLIIYRLQGLSLDSFLRHLISLQQDWFQFLAAVVFGLLNWGNLISGNVMDLIALNWAGRWRHTMFLFNTLAQSVLCKALCIERWLDYRKCWGLVCLCEGLTCSGLCWAPACSDCDGGLLWLFEDMGAGCVCVCRATAAGLVSREL